MPEQGRGTAPSSTRRGFLKATSGRVSRECAIPSVAAQPQVTRPKTLLVKNASILVTMDASRRELRDGGLFIRAGRIEQVGPTSELPAEADEVLDLKDHIVLPGLVNTHHHLYQTLTRVVPGAMAGGVSAWLKALYPIWARMTPEALRAASLAGLAELVLSGCTTVFDQLYVFPNGCRLDDTVDAAREIGVRFHAGRGSMSIADPKNGPPKALVENEDAILKDCRRVLEAYHDPKPGAMTRVALAPSALYLSSPDFLRETAKLAKATAVQLHMHLAKSRFDEQYTRAKYNLRPVEFLEKVGWINGDAFFAHCVHLSDADVEIFTRNGCGIAHCPSSNMLQPTGIPRIHQYRSAGVQVGIGVDVSANTSGQMLGELREALLLAHSAGPDARESTGGQDRLDVGPRCSGNGHAGWQQGAGRDDIGVLEPGKRADFFALDLSNVDFSGALHDPVAAVVLCSPQKADFTVIEGRVVVRKGRLTTVDLPRVIEKHNRLARRIVGGS